MDNMGGGVRRGNVMEQEERLWRGKKSEAGVRLTHLHNKRLTSRLYLEGLSFSSNTVVSFYFVLNFLYFTL